MVFSRRYLYSLIAGVFLYVCSLNAAFAYELQWLGQSAFKLTTETGKVIMIDPFITPNPVTPEEFKDLSVFGKVDLILVTHGHGDHSADAAALSEMYNAPVGMNGDMRGVYGNLGIIPGERLIGWNKSGTITPLGEDIKITMVRAEHSSSVNHAGEVHPGGEPVGFIIELENGFTIYHSGDTGVFGDMKLIGKLYQPDLALVCIGGWFTMGPADAAYAMDKLMKPKTVIPMHYGTFPALTGTPEELKQHLRRSKVQVKVMTPGEVISG